MIARFIYFPVFTALGQYYFRNRYGVAFFGGFTVKTKRYAAASLSQSHNVWNVSPAAGFAYLSCASPFYQKSACSTSNPYTSYLQC